MKNKETSWFSYNPPTMNIHVTIFFLIIEQQRTHCCGLWLKEKTHLQIFLGQLLTKPYALKIRSIQEEMRKRKNIGILSSLLRVWTEQFSDSKFIAIYVHIYFRVWSLFPTWSPFTFYIFKLHGQVSCNGIYICFSIWFQILGNWIRQLTNRIEPEKFNKTFP